jgi:large subunit ribosomal protein L25
LIHIDLKRIAMDKVLHVKVRVKLHGIPEGVKSGGILDQVMREVDIECLPADIPGHFDVDVSHLELHQVLRVSGLPHSEKFKYLNSEEATVAHVATIREEAPTAAEVEAAEAAAAAAATAEGATPGEPEVAKKGGKAAEDAAKKPDAAAKKPEAKK